MAMELHAAAGEVDRFGVSTSRIDGYAVKHTRLGTREGLRDLRRWKLSIPIPITQPGSRTLSVEGPCDDVTMAHFTAVNRCLDVDPGLVLAVGAGGNPHHGRPASNQRNIKKLQPILLV